MITKIRITTSIFILSILSGIGWIPYLMLFGDVKRNGIEIVLLLVFFAGVFCVTIFTSIFKIDHQNRIFRVKYPFRLKIKKYSFDDILGYYFSTMNGGRGPEYKVIYFKMKDGNEYGITDFETSNLRELERYSIKYFSLWDKVKSEIASKERETEILQEYQNFDYKQAKEIRWRLIIGLGLLMFFLVIFIKEVTFSKPLSFYTIAISLIVFALVKIIDKLIRIQRKIKNGVEHQTSKKTD